MAKKYISDTDKILAVIQQGSISSAAKTLGIDQSSLSRTVKEFETEMRTALFVRTDNGVTLTEAGEICAEHLWKLKKAEEDLKKELAYFRSSEKKLTVALPLYISHRDREEMENVIRQRYPFVHIHIVNTRYSTVAQGILPEEDARFVYEKFFDDRLLLLVPEGHMVNSRNTFSDAAYETVSVQDLNGMDFVLQNCGTTVRRVIDRILNDHGISVNVRMLVSDSHLAVKAAEAGIGCALVIESQDPLRNEKAGCRTYVLDERPGESIGLLRLAEREMTPAENYAAEVIREFFMHRKQRTV